MANVAAALIPDNLPKGFTQLQDEPEFNPCICNSKRQQTFSACKILGMMHIQGLLESPVDFAATSMRISAEGAAALTIRRRHEPFATSNPRIERNVRGGVYRSKFLRDLCLCEDITGSYGKLLVTLNAA